MTLEAIYKQHFRFVWRALVRLGVPERDLPDAVQDVFVVVHRKLDQFEGRSKLETWLYGICLKTASDRRRRASTRAEVLDATTPERSHSGLGREVEHRDRIRTLEAILNTLPQEQRAVFTLFELDERTSGQIAQLLVIPIGTVNSRLRLARQGFRRELERRQASDGFRLRAGGID